METCFFAQKLASGKLSIRCKIFYNSKYSNPISLKILLEKEEYWKKGKVYGCKNAKVYNEQINQVDRDLKVIYNRLVSLEEAITSEKIKSIYTNKKLPEKTALDFVKDFTEKKLNEGWEHDTNRKFRRYYKDFENFLIKRKIKNKTLSEFNVKNAIDYFEFLRKIPNSEKIAKNKVLYVKSAFDYAKSKELIKNNPLNNLSIKVRLPTPKIVFLFQDERERLEQKNFTGKLERERDIFVFQMYTGLSNIEVQRFDANKHLFEQNNKKWISFDRQKTAVYIGIPLFRKALTILEKYDYELPMISLGKRNAYLKEIAVLCRIEKNLTTHVARKTFGAYLLNEEGVSLPVVSRLLGHSKIETTLKWYTPILTSKILSEVGHLT